MEYTEKELERRRAVRRRYYEKHREKEQAYGRAYSREYRKTHGTKLDKALRDGPEAVAALREKTREQSRKWREAHGKKKGTFPRGTGAKKLIVTVKPRDVPDTTRQKHADLGWLIEEIGAVTIRRLRRSKEARRDFAVWTAARDSLPARPVAAEFEAWIAALGRGEHGGAPLKAASLKNVYFRLSALYRTAGLLGMEIRNPFGEFPEPKDTAHPAAYSWRVVLEGFPRLLAATTDWRERAFLTVLRYTGLRLNEVLGLRREHVLLSPGGKVELQIATQRARVAAALSEDAPLKHDRQRRILPLSNTDLISALLHARRETPSLVWTRNAENRPVLAESHFLFPFSVGRMRILDARLHAVLPDLPFGVGWHAFRHAYSAEARLIARATIDEISQWLGHSSPEVTRGYLRSLLGEQPDLADFSARVAAAQLRKPVAIAPVLELKKT